jgi:hypothetical protein
MTPLFRTVAGLLFALAAARGAMGYEPIGRIPATDLTPRVASLSPGPRVGEPVDAAGIWPADNAGRFWQLNPLATEILPDPPPLIGPYGGVPTYPEGFTDPSLMYNEPIAPPPRHVWPYKDGFFQKLSVVGAWLPDAGTNDLETTELKAFVTVALPLPTSDFPLLITPNFETRLLEGPLTPDLPPRVYSATVQFMWVPKISERWLGILAIEPGVYSDFDHYDPNAWRTLGRAIVRYDWIPDYLQVGAGVLYLDRDDFNILPVGGVIWNPIDDVRLEIIFPQPRAAYRLGWNGRREDWVYLAAEIGGDSFSITRAAGQREKVALFDIRLNLGLEQQYNGGGGARIELGYVFYRQVDYFSATPDLDLNPTVMLRAGFAL